VRTAGVRVTVKNTTGARASARCATSLLESPPARATSLSSSLFQSRRVSASPSPSRRASPGTGASPNSREGASTPLHPLLRLRLPLYRYARVRIEIPIFISVEAHECEREGNGRQGATAGDPAPGVCDSGGSPSSRGRCWRCFHPCRRRDASGVLISSGARAREEAHTRAHHHRPTMRQTRHGR
jgi:hypothetical protein